MMVAMVAAFGGGGGGGGSVEGFDTGSVAGMVNRWRENMALVICFHFTPPPHAHTPTDTCADTHTHTHTHAHTNTGSCAYRHFLDFTQTLDIAIWWALRYAMCTVMRG